MNMSNFLRDAIVILYVDALALLNSWGSAAIPAGETMITYLYLLRHNPFFAGLDINQLRRTIRHSNEWEVQPRTTLATRGKDGEPFDYAVWILLDGRWRLEENGRGHESGNSDAGKWFSAAALPGPCRLAVTERSYV